MSNVIDDSSFINENKFVYEIRHYLTAQGKDIYLQWLEQLRDGTARVAIIRRINRVQLGNFGDHKFLRDGVWELRIDLGPGYRLYYGIENHQIVLLLCGGDKSTQVSDISRACAQWQEWREREEPNDKSSKRQISR